MPSEVDITRIGSLGVYDTMLTIWEEPSMDGHGLPEGYERDFTDNVFIPLRRFMRRRGYRLYRDPRGKDYKCIAKWMWLAARQTPAGLLEVSLNLRGISLEVSFFQNIVRDNPNGGRYDFERFAKMPYLIRKRFVSDLMALISYLKKKHGYAGPKLAEFASGKMAAQIEWTCRYGRQIPPTIDPLGYFNNWDGDLERKLGIHRFDRGLDGWPTEKELSYWPYRDRDGTHVAIGMECYWMSRTNGHVLRGRAYPNMNGMCFFVYGTGPRDWTQIGAWELFTPKPGESLRKCHDIQRDTQLNKELRRAVEAQDFERAIVLRNLIKRAA